MFRRGLTLTTVIFLAICLLYGGAFAAEQPKYGGTLRILVLNGPQVMSYEPMMGPGDHSAMFPAGERLVETTGQRDKNMGTEPWLAEKVVEDIENLTITWYIRQGVKFHDGSDLNAEVVAWNFQMILDSKTLPYQGLLKEMKVEGEYKLVMYLNEYSNQLVPSWGFWPIITSKAAWDKASGGDLAKGKEWARTHIVGTGPFMLEDYTRDVVLKWKKNPNYWVKGQPYLDAIEVRIIPDPVTCSAMMQAKEADIWEGAPPNDQNFLEQMGMVKQSSWPALGYSLWINTANKDSKWQDKRLREAVEYALDKKTIARALGLGTYRPLKSLPPEGEWGYDPNYDPRPYNPEKARQLVKEAGYPNGCKIKLKIFIGPTAQDAGTALKQYLDEGGFIVDLDIADPGRFFGTVYGPTPPVDEDLAWWITGRDSTYLLSYMRWFSTNPFTNLAYLGHTPEQEELDKIAQKLTDTEEQKAITQKCMRLLTDNAMIIPVFDVPAVVMQQPNVHNARYQNGFTRWKTGIVWKDK